MDGRSALVQRPSSRLLLLGIWVLAAIVWWPALFNGFTNWDDPAYVLENMAVRQGDWGKLLTATFAGNYHPLTMLSLAVDYRIGDGEAFQFHLTNVILHLANIGLVFWLILKLTGGHKTTAFITALGFGIHPMHVESVVWISERKDVLHVGFYLASLVMYLSWLEKPDRKGLWAGSFLLFIGGLLAKATTVTLPLVLLAIDHYRGRKINIAAITAKAPYGLAALVVGIYALMAQQEALPLEAAIGPVNRLTIGLAAYGGYLLKALVPVNLSAFYDYPAIVDGWLPAYYYLSWLIPLLIIFLVITYRASRALIFAIAWFTVTIILVLQFFPVGGAMMADRYTYLPAVGIFFLAGRGFIWLRNRVPWKRRTSFMYLMRFLLVGWLALFALLTRNRIAVWENSETLWSDVLKTDPASAIAYANRAAYYQENGAPEKALADLRQVIALKPGYAGGYFGRGKYYQETQQLQLALEDYQKALSLQSDYPAVYYQMGLLYQQAGKFAEATKHYSTLIRMEPDHIDAYNNRGIAYKKLGNFDLAEKDHQTAIRKAPGHLPSYLNRGNLYFEQKAFDKAIKDYQFVLSRDPDYKLAYYNLSMAYYETGDYPNAFRFAKQAGARGIAIPQEYIQLLRNKMEGRQ